MPFELVGCTRALLWEIEEEEQFTQRDIAKTYALALRSSERTDWPTVNRAIIKRWSKTGLERIKEMAWSGTCFKTKEEIIMAKNYDGWALYKYGKRIKPCGTEYTRGNMQKVACMWYSCTGWWARMIRGEHCARRRFPTWKDTEEAGYSVKKIKITVVE